jgi:hypothetical protein
MREAGDERPAAADAGRAPSGGVTQCSRHSTCNIPHGKGLAAQQNRVKVPPLEAPVAYAAISELPHLTWVLRVNNEFREDASCRTSKQKFPGASGDRLRGDERRWRNSVAHGSQL